MAPSLRVLAGSRQGEVIPVETAMTVGREPDCDLQLDDDRLSRHHARLRPVGDAVEVEDLRSTNGSFVNGRRISEPTVLRAGDVLRLGTHEFGLAGGAPATVVSSPGTVVETPAEFAGRPAGPPAAPPIAVPVNVPTPPVSVPPPPAATGGGKGKGLIIGAIAAVVVLVAVVGFVVLRGGGDATDQELFEEAKRSTVLIGASVNGRSTGSGTGWVLDAEQGLIVTNQHVVNAGTAWSVGLGTDKQPAVLIGSAPCEDLAVLRVSDRRNLRTLPIGKQTDFKQGDRVIALGYPGTASASPTLVFTAGNISAVNTTWDAQSLDVPSYPNVVLHTAQINPGNSGGPLINSSGELVGVNSAGLTQRGGRPIQGQNYAVGADRVKEIVGRLRTGKSIFYTGMSFDYPTTERDFDSLDLPVVDGGIIVPFATPESPAANAGFGTEPVVLVAVDGKELNGTLQSYCQAVRGVRDGDQVPFTIVLGSGRQGDIRVRVPV